MHTSIEVIENKSKFLLIDIEFLNIGRTEISHIDIELNPSIRILNTEIIKILHTNIEIIEYKPKILLIDIEIF